MTAPTPRADAARREAMLARLDELDAIFTPRALAGDLTAAGYALTVIEIRSHLFGLYTTPVNWTARQQLGLE